MLASLNHTNIGAIYELEESDGTHALALELVGGRERDAGREDKVWRDVLGAPPVLFRPPIGFASRGGATLPIRVQGKLSSQDA